MPKKAMIRFASSMSADSYNSFGTVFKSTKKISLQNGVEPPYSTKIIANLVLSVSSVQFTLLKPSIINMLFIMLYTGKNISFHIVAVTTCAKIIGNT